jgi:hypothetical protein
MVPSKARWSFSTLCDRVIFGSDTFTANTTRLIQTHLKSMKRFQNTLRLCLLLASTTGISFAVTIDNGSLDGLVAGQSVPSGWSPSADPNVAAGFTNPDTNDLANPAIAGAYNPAVPVTSSSDGGTWVGFHDRRDAGNNNYNEGLVGLIEDLVVGQSYTVSWEAANFGAIASFITFNKNGFVQLEVAGSTYDGLLMPLGTSWTPDSYSFVATNTTEPLTFRAFSTDGGDNNGFDGAYLSIDGITVIPEASFFWLVGCVGLWPLLARRRA